MYILFFITKKILKWLFNQYQIKNRGQILQRNLLEIFSLQVVVMTFRLKNKTDRGIVVRIRLIHQNCDRMLTFSQRRKLSCFLTELTIFLTFEKEIFAVFLFKIFRFWEIVARILCNLFQFISIYIKVYFLNRIFLFLFWYF